MKTLWNISWSQYSWFETWQIFKAYSVIISDASIPEPFNSNILHIAAKSHDLELMKKILYIEDEIDINEKDANGWTALHIASYFGELDMVKFLIKQESAAYKITTEYEESPISLCVGHLDFETTKYYLKLGEEMPSVSTICFGNRTREKFLQKLKDHFQAKLDQKPDNITYQNILAQIQEKQKKYVESDTSQSSELSELIVTSTEEKNDSKEVIGDSENISDLV